MYDIIEKKEMGERIVSQGESVKFAFDLPLDKSKSYKLNVVGEVDIDYILRFEEVLPFYYRKTDDSIKFIDGKKVLTYTARNLTKERTAYAMIKDVSAGEYTLSIRSKVKGLNSEFTLTAEVYYGANNTRYYYEKADETVTLALKESEDFTDDAVGFSVKEHAAFIMIKIEATGFTGEAELYAPGLFGGDGKNLCPDFDYLPDNINDFKWVCEGFSVLEKPKYKISLNGKVFYDGIIMDRLERFAGFSLNVPDELVSDGENEFEIYYYTDNVKPYRIKEVRLISAPRGFEPLGVKKQLALNEPFGVFCYSESDEITAEESEYYEYKGFTRVSGNYGVMRFVAKKCGVNVPVTVNGKTVTVSAITESLQKGIITGTGDFIYVSQNIDEFAEYLYWYLTKNVGDLLTFRCVYHWCGDEQVNLGFWRAAEELLSMLGIYFSMMRDGRELNGVNVTPPDEFFKTEYYLGSQTHERDGAFTYWAQEIKQSNELYYHALSRKIKYNGIYGKRSPVYAKNGTPYLYYAPDKAENVKDAYENLKENLRLTGIDGATRHTGVTPFFRTFYEAGYKWLGYESMYGPHELLLGALRGATESFNGKGSGTHLALQWSTVPADDEKHFIRYGLSLYLSYMHGATEINTEEGLWRIENPYEDYDRYSHACFAHTERQTKFNDFIKSHKRRGKLKTDIAMIIGKYDGMDAFSTPCVYGQKKWKVSKPEKSWDLLKTFYPESDINAIYYYITKDVKNGIPEKYRKIMEVRKGLYLDFIEYRQVGFYTNTPYGVIDIIPVDDGKFSDYKFLFFTGWNTATESQLEKLCEFVENGGTLLLSKPHLYDTVIREDALRGAASVIDSPLREKLLSYRGTGRVIYFDRDAYPADYAEEYSAVIRKFAQKYASPYIRDTKNVSFTEYETQDGARVYYLLNIDWWDENPAEYTLTLGKKAYKKLLFGNDPLVVTVKDGVAIYTDNLYADVEKIENGFATLTGYGETAVHIITENGERIKTVLLDGKNEIKI